MSQPSRSPSTSAPLSRKEERHFLPPELMNILIPSVKVGACTGALGLFSGAVFGILRTSTPSLFAIGAGAQWFTLGSSYYASRQIIDAAWGGSDKLSPVDKVKASALSGGCAGMLGGLLRGPRNIVPGILMFSIYGAVGQAILNSASFDFAKPRFNAMLSSKWSPVTPLTDLEYEQMLETKLLRVEADLAIVDEKIQAIRDEARQDAEPTRTGKNRN